MRENFDCKDGCLTLEGFLNLFALQSCGMSSAIDRLFLVLAGVS
jgi:hypothetical protein